MGHAASRQPTKTPTLNLDKGGLLYVFLCSEIVKYFSDSLRTIGHPMPNSDLAIYSFTFADISDLLPEHKLCHLF